MLNFKEDKTIDECNEEIRKCVDLAKMMETKPWKFLIEFMDELEILHKHRDITAIKPDTLLRMQGVIDGIMQVRNLFEDIKIESEKDERDPVSGRPIPRKSTG